MIRRRSLQVALMAAAILNWLVLAQGVTGAAPAPSDPQESHAAASPSGPQAQRLQDPGFEAGPSNPYWNQYPSGSPKISTLHPRSGSWSAGLCGYNDCEEAVDQGVAVPTGVLSARLSYYFAMFTAEPAPACFDFLAIGLSDTPAGGAPIAGAGSIFCEDFAGGNYHFNEIDVTSALQSRGGSSVYALALGSTDDGAQSAFFVDDVSLEIIVAPGPPTNIRADPPIGNCPVVVSWAPPADDGGSPITGFEVTSSPGDITVNAGPNQRSARVDGLTNGISYTFTVKARNALGTSVPSAASDNVFPSSSPECIVTTQTMPEGATHSGFATFALLANPSGTDAITVDLTLLTSASGVLAEPTLQNLVIDPQRRRTVSLNEVLDPPQDVATLVTTYSYGLPVVAELAMHKVGSLASLNMGAALNPSPTWILPEGATHSGFTTFVTIANPAGTATHVDIDYLTASGGLIDGSDNLLVPAGSRVTLNVGSPLADGGCDCVDDVSTRITVVGSEPGVVAGMSIHKLEGGDVGMGGSLGVTQTEDTWVVSEGATHSGFHTFVLVANPGDTPATVSVTYLTGSQGSVIDDALDIPARSRRTIDVNSRLAAAGKNPDDVSTLIASTLGTVAVESTIQKQDVTGFVIADSVASGGASIAAATGTMWLAAEGATHSGFSTFILISNPDTVNGAQIDVTFLTPTISISPSELQNFVVPAGSRRTLSVGDFVPGQDVSTLVKTDAGRVVMEFGIDRVTSQGFSKGRSLGSRLAS